MKLTAPVYYKKFKCIADKCRHSCCVGWEIDVDEKTLEKYAALKGENAKRVQNSLEICDTGAHFKLGEGERCPHLDSCGLCNIITEYGEDMLCDICREHPRFYNLTARGKEVGIGAACEAAANIILSSEDYRSMLEIGDSFEKIYEKEIDTPPIRDEVYSILSNDSTKYENRLERLYEKYAASPKSLSDEEWREIIENLEYLEQSHRDLFSSYTSSPKVSPEHEKSLERFLAYLIYRHASGADTSEELRISLGFCFFLERLLSSLLPSGIEPQELARIISEEIEYSEENTETIKLEFI